MSGLGASPEHGVGSFVYFNVLLFLRSGAARKRSGVKPGGSGVVGVWVRRDRVHP